ncbi:GNAT family N-acetyltransferase [Kribbella sandramycini]|uniref:GNAT family N-acetyltransferase n=1 Tax=Kribbella sandramycini TaxID=60450 RepID=A0A7Y4L8P5_9ACTN|nr:GNAT family N-acetyltransferase [Kribbella sandramycini]MBB6570379.1 L-amino acid N-acyltransferase YncA [Kribbella sandramycini]NOL45241.1 GNAT family N-acetyltransferase [Kribbella sandramycini]
MLWKIRTELADRPGALAELAARCGADDINILSLEVFTAETGAVDELVVSTGVGWTADDLTALVAEAGCVRTTVRPCQADVLSDAPTRYLRAVLRLIDDPMSVDDELGALQGFEEYTPAEWARADVLVEIAGRLVERLQEPVLDGPRPGAGEPELRRASVEDAEAVVAMHERCSHESRTRRYHVPMPKLTARTARHLSAPAGGVSIVAGVDDAVIGMATAAPWEELGGTAMEVAVLVEDGWQGRGLGAQLLRQVITAARDLGADRAVCVVQPENAAMLRTIEGLRMRTRVVQDGANLMVTVALSQESLSHAVDRPPVQYGRSRAIPARSQSTRPSGQPAREHALAALSALQPLHDRGGAVDPDGADRGDRP